MNQQQIVDGLREERERFIEYLADVPDASWDLASLCEGWRIRDVVAHLIGNCADVIEQNLEGLGTPEYNQRQVDARASAPPRELLEEWREKGPAVEAVYAAFPPEIWEYPMDGVIGTVGRGVLRHLEDLWIHAQDVRIPLGDDPTATVGLEAVLDLAETEIPLALQAAGSNVAQVELRFGDSPRTIACMGSGPGVRVSGDPIAFALAATGRRSIASAQAEGRLVVEPDILDDAAINIYGAGFTARL